MHVSQFGILIYMDTNKNILLKVMGVVIIAALVYLIWVSVMKSASSKVVDVNTGTVCTQEAKQCPDGTWVGRTGTDCQFVCPVPAATTTQKDTVTVEAKLNITVTPIGDRITVLSVLEDSRCPVDVQCIQAGTVRVRTKVQSGLGTSQVDFTLNKLITTEAEEITLIDVKPVKESKNQISSSDYIFTFRVTKR